VSAWLAQAATERLERERWAAAIDEYETANGRITEDDIADARARTAWQPPTQRRSSPAA
jgi:hypothetical protein